MEGMEGMNLTRFFNDKTNTSYKQAYMYARLSIIAQARKILQNHPNLHEFILANGMWYFTDKNDIALDTLSYMTPLENFIMKWDDDLHITGNPMRFTAHGEVKNNW